MREILLPSLGEGVETGTVVSILVKEGDMIEQEQGLIEVETDKVTTEVPSDYAGRVSKIVVQDGQEISQGETILLLEEMVTEQEPVPAPSFEISNPSSQEEEIKPGAASKPSEVDVDVSLPSLGEGLNGGTVVSILVSKGDLIQAEQELIEVETDKVTMAVPSDYAGEVLDIYVTEGDEVSVGSAIIKIKPTGIQTVPQNEPPEEKRGHLNDQLGLSPELEYAASIKPPNLKELQAHGQIRSSSSSRTTPRARKLARQLNVDLQHVNASDGLITSDRIKSYVRSEKTNITGPSNIDDAISPRQLPEFNDWGVTRREPMTGMMKATARNMSESWRTIPHA